MTHNITYSTVATSPNISLNKSTHLGVVDLDVSTLKVTFRVLKGGAVNAFLGSSIRGALGRALKLAICHVNSETPCQDCFFKSRCDYTKTFEPLRANFKVNSSMLNQQNQIPAPLVIAVEHHDMLNNQQKFTFKISIIGDFSDAMKRVLLDALTNLTFFGKERVKLKLLHVEQVLPFNYFPAHSDITLTLKSPLTIKKKGRVLVAQTFELDAFLLTLLRRVKTLCVFYGEQILAEQEKAWRAAISEVRLCDQALTDVSWNRYSFRQNKSIPMKGIWGHFKLVGAGVETLLPLLQLGEQIHVGKGAFMGLGNYQITHQ